MRLIPARPEQTTIPQIARDALRAAALAPTYQEALDATGAALHRIAELSRSPLAASFVREVRHEQ